MIWIPIQSKYIGIVKFAVDLKTEDFMTLAL